jgi:hypothetical protein
LELSAVFFVSFCPTGVAVKSTFVIVPPVVEVEVLDFFVEPVPFVESFVLVDGDFALVPVAPPPVGLLDGPWVPPGFPCVLDDGPCVGEEPCEAVCADGPWFPELPRCAYIGTTVNDTTAITPAETWTTRIA